MIRNLVLAAAAALLVTGCSKAAQKEVAPPGSEPQTEGVPAPAPPPLAANDWHFVTEGGSADLDYGDGDWAISLDDLRALGEKHLADHPTIVDDTANEANADALLLTTLDGVPVGWVPDLLIDYTHQVRAAGGHATVVQNNGPGAPWHMRLLVKVAGRLPAGTAVFTGGPWPPVH